MLIPLCIVLPASFFRFYNYQNRWTLNEDQARDAITASFALSHHLVPLLGPPSSAGPFSFGPAYYWIIMFFSSLSFGVINGPWIGFTLLSILTVCIFYLIGTFMGDKRFASILGLIAACASAPIYFAPDMLNPMLVPVATTFSFLFLVLFLKTNQKKYASLLGLSVGLAISFHLQAVGLILLLPIALFLEKSKISQKVLNLCLFFAGAIIPFLPVFYFEFSHGHVISKNIAFFFTGKSDFNPLGLISDLLIFWPKLWGQVLTYVPKMGYIFIALLLSGLFFYVKKSFKKDLSFNILATIILSFVTQIILLRIYSGSRLEVYLLVFHAYFIFLTSWSIRQLWKLNTSIGVFILVGVLSLAVFSDWKIINGSSQFPLVENMVEKINQKSRGTIDLYDNDKSHQISLPLYYILNNKKRISDNGYKIAACDNVLLPDQKTQNCPTDFAPFTNTGSYYLYDLNGRNLEETPFKQITEEKVYSFLYSRYK